MNGISHLQAFGRLFYPASCASCSSALLLQEKYICTMCQITLPVSNYHQMKINPMDSLLKLRMRVDFISSYLLYDKGLSTQNILHSIKYNGNKLLAYHLGLLYGLEIKASFEHFPDYIVPVPLHKRKQRQRGFNQSEFWANGLAGSLGVPSLTDSLVRTKFTKTQTRKTREERIKNVSNVFSVKNKELIKGKSILLVDDVITTGATLEACGNELWNAGIRSLNIATIAFAVK